jgi:cellulose biosynthesis protein BcsQ
VPIIAISNQKGGVGKTTSTLNLGAALRESGKRVLQVDLDPQGSLTVAAGVLDVDAVRLSVGRGVFAEATRLFRGLARGPARVAESGRTPASAPAAHSA